MRTLARLRERFDRHRLRLASSQAVITLALFGLISGFATGAVIVLFRLLIENGLQTFMPAGEIDNFEGLPGAWRLALPAAGA